MTKFQNCNTDLNLMELLTSRVVKLPVIYVGGKLPVTYRPLPARMGHQALVLKAVGHYYMVNIS